MDLVTKKRLGIPVEINGVGYIAVESHLLPELGPVAGDGISLVVFSSTYLPVRNDEVVFKGLSYKVTRWFPFNGKPRIFIEDAMSDN